MSLIFTITSACVLFLFHSCRLSATNFNFSFDGNISLLSLLRKTMSFDVTFPSFLLGDTRCVDFFVVLARPICLLLLKLIHLRTRFVSGCFLILPLRFSINNVSSRKRSGYFSCNFSLNSIFVFSTTFCVSASNSCTKRFSLSCKAEFHWLLKSSEIDLIAGSFFILKPNDIICFSNVNL